MIDDIFKCTKCPLYLNQSPLLDKVKKADNMWVGLSAKKVDDVKEIIQLDIDTNTGVIIRKIEDKLDNYTFYKTNLVKCLPLDSNNKLRYPNDMEINACIGNLIKESDYVKPKIIFLLGRKVYKYVTKYINKHDFDRNINIYYIEHPSYIYVYKRKYIDDYVNKVVNIVIGE